MAEKPEKKRGLTYAGMRVKDRESEESIEYRL